MYYLASKETLNYIMSTSIDKLKEIKKLTTLCNGNTDIIDSYIEIKRKIKV